MRRREFIRLLAGLATAWPFTSRAQKLEGFRRVAVLDGSAASDADGQERHAILRSSLRELGWIEGKNLQIEARWGEGNVENTKKFAGELVALGPNLIYAFFNAQVRILSQQTRAR